MIPHVPEGGLSCNSTVSGQAGWEGPPVAVLWDQSLVWGIICLDTLQRMGIPVHLLNGEDIAGGVLKRYRILLVPGGWASHKMRALGEAGKSQVRHFIETGGSYIGFCGGAGLALSSPPALELVPLERMSLAERLPNASGRVTIRGISGHPAWKDLPEELPVSIWWPSQFSWQPLPRSLCLASYTAARNDFWVADLPLADLQDRTIPWQEWEGIYGINLNPRRLIGQPAIMEMRLGKGRLILSYPHLETPGDELGNRLFLNILGYLNHEASLHPSRVSGDESGAPPVSRFAVAPRQASFQHFARIQKTVDDLILFGERHLLWKWRHPWLLHWRRGIRGMEYGTLAVAIRSIVQVAAMGDAPSLCTDTADPWLESAKRLEEDVQVFCHLARHLLLEEKLATQSGNLSKLGKVNETVDALRERLFGSKMNHGGLCRQLFDEMDGLLLHLLRQSLTCREASGSTPSCQEWRP